MTDPVPNAVVVQPPAPKTFTEKYGVWVILAVFAASLATSYMQGKGWITPDQKAQADKIAALMLLAESGGETVTISPTKPAEKRPATDSVIHVTAAKPSEPPRADSVEAITPEQIQQWIDLIAQILDKLPKPQPKPVPVPPVPVPPQPVPPTPQPHPVPPTPHPTPGTLTILVADELGKPITASTVEAGQLFRVSAVGSSGDIAWQTVKHGGVRLSASTDGKEFTGYLSGGEWVDFGLTDYVARKQLSVRISCGEGPRPPPVPPQPEPKPQPQPTPNPSASVIYHPVYDPSQITPSVARVLNAVDWWNAQRTAGDDYLFYSTASTEPKGLKAIAALKTAGVPPPGLVITNKAGDVLAAVSLPKTTDEIASVGAKAKGK